LKKKSALILPKIRSWRQSYKALISSFFWFSLLNSAILKYRQYFLMLQTLKLTNKKQKKSLFSEEKSLVGLTPWNQSYKSLISSFFRFLLLSLSVCSIRQYCLCFKMAKLNSEKRKKSSFYEERSLVGLTHWAHGIIKRMTVVFPKPFI
jgi:hypothetical protein